ncbi:hypothetical protein [Nonomuraea turcica]|uniref:hypothetical protein n=1 Tax=Nonomuraea sp. G32 TaxID=3067274 RepID=UPI00273B1FA0|nr:hypothetical protein [Nonomuraea sp. G32]MDP4501099.1 hypothetical protein [Nonomuraea sp. G32]
MSELFRNVEITYEGDDRTPRKLYAQVSEGQYEMLLNPHDLAAPPGQVVMSVYAQLTPTGGVVPRVIRLSWVTSMQLWEPPPDSGIVREGWA